MFDWKNGRPESGNSKSVSVLGGLQKPVSPPRLLVVENMLLFELEKELKRSNKFCSSKKNIFWRSERILAG